MCPVTGQSVVPAATPPNSLLVELFPAVGDPARRKKALEDRIQRASFEIRDTTELNR
jgi:hypothetical protein